MRAHRSYAAIGFATFALLFDLPPFAGIGGELRAQPAPTVSPLERPDFSGVWRLDEHLSAAAQPRRPGPDGLPRGWKGLAAYAAPNAPPALRPEAIAKVNAHEVEELAGGVPDRAAAACKYANIFDLLSQPGSIDVFQHWDEVVVLTDRARALARHIYIDHHHPDADTRVPAVNGHSIARWDGQTLTIDTVGFDAHPFLASADYIPLSEDTHIEERWRLENADTLRITWTVTDPAIFTAPWGIDLVYRRQPAGTQLPEAVCTLNAGGMQREK